MERRKEGRKEAGEMKKKIRASGGRVRNEREVAKIAASRRGCFHDIALEWIAARAEMKTRTSRNSQLDMKSSVIRLLY